MGLENLCGHASGIADDGGEHDGAIDIASTASPRRRCGCLQDAPDVLRHAERVLRVRRLLRALQDTRDDVGPKTLGVDLTRIEHGDGVGIVAESREQVIERHVGRACRAGEVGAARQRCREIRRHRDLRNICCRYAHDVSRKTKAKTGRTGHDQLQ
jgi:hypothetical protein